MYSDGAAFCSERKLSSLLNHDVLRLGFEVQTCPVSVAACPGTLKVVLCLPVCLQQSGRRLGSPKRDLKLYPSRLGSGHSSLAARQVEDPVSSGSRHLSPENLE